MSTIDDNSRPALLDMAIIELSFPCSAEYVSIARLAILGIASRMSIAYDEVEDIRLAVGEACSHAVERATRAPGQAPTNQGYGTITIISRLTASELIIEVNDDVPVGPQSALEPDEDEEELDIDRAGLGALLMEILVDTVEISSGLTGSTVRLVKHAH